MKIVCPFTALEPETRAALDRSGYIVEYQWVGGSDTAYPELIAHLWHTEWRGFIVNEHDVIIPQESLDAMVNCVHDFCCVPYEWGTNTGPAMGATKFGQLLISECPNAASEALGVSWRQFDVIFMRNVLGKRYQRFPHVHLPIAAHLNPDKSPLVSPYDTWSVESHLNNLGWWLDGEDGLTASYRGGAYGA